MKEKHATYSILAFVVLAITYLLISRMNRHEIFPYIETTPRQAYEEDIVIIDIRPLHRCEATGKPKGSYRLPIDDKSSPEEHLAKIRDISKGRTTGLICNIGKSSKIIAMQYRDTLDAFDITSVMGGVEGDHGWLEEKLPTEPCSAEPK